MFIKVVKVLTDVLFLVLLHSIFDFKRETDVLVILVLHAYIAVEWVP